MTSTSASKTDDLKQRVVQSGVAKLGGQMANFVLRLISIVVMARLLTPADVGLFAMVAVVTGFYGLLTAAGLGLIIGGAMGNVIDRVRFGAVVDFLDFHALGWHWPAFNVADSAIFIGAVLLLVDGLLMPRRHST